MRLRQITATMAFAAAAVCACAQTDIYTAAWQMAANNKTVSATKEKYEARRHTASAENMLSGPELDMDYKVSEHDAEHRWGIGVGQSFDWPGVYSARRKANAFRGDAFSYLYQSALADAAYEAMQALVKLAAADERLGLLHTAAENARSRNESLEYAFSRGEITVLDYRKAQLELFAIRSRVASVEAERADCLAAVKALNGGTEPEEIPALPADAIVEPLENYAEMFAAYNPALAANRSLAAAFDADVTVARRSALPSFKISYLHEFEEDMHYDGVGLSISLPSWGKSRGASVAKAEAQAARFEAEDYTARINAELAASHARAVVLNRRVDQARPTFTDTSYPELLATALDKGKITVIDYFNEYNVYLEAASEYVQLKADLALAMAYLNRYTAPSK